MTKVIPNAADIINVDAGFFVDLAGNPSLNDPPNVGITWTDATAPQITSIMAVESSSGEPVLDGDGEPVLVSSGSYNNGDSMFIVAMLDEEVLEGSAVTANLSSGASVRLTAAANQDYLIGEYVIATENELTSLDVVSLSTVAADDSVDTILDRFANSNTDPSIPGTNISESNGSIIIDNLPVLVASSTVVDSDDTDGSVLNEGDVITINFTDVVGNYATIASDITAATAVYGTGVTAIWDNDYESLTITLGETETVDNTIVLEGVEDLTGNSADLTVELEIV